MGLLARSVVAVAAVAATLAALAGGSRAADPPDAGPGTEVTVVTADGMRLAATWWDEPRKGSAGVVLLHGCLTDRSVWGPVVDPLRARGVEVLAIDLRGHGGSAVQHGVDLAPLAAHRDGSLFPEMHADVVAAAQWLVRRGGCDRGRIALVGADVAGTVAIDAARRRPTEIAAVTVLNPAPAAFGVDAAALVRGLPSRKPLLLLSERSVVESARALRDAFPSARLVEYPDPERDVAIEPGSVVGGASLLRWPLVPQTVASFVASATGSRTDDVVLDGIVETSGPHADPWSRATRVEGPGAGTAWAYRVGPRIQFAGAVPKGYEAFRLELDDGRGEAEGLGSWDFVHSATFEVATGQMQSGVVPRRRGVDRAIDAERFRRMTPAVRVVRSGDRVTFEGEWTMEAAPAPTDAVRFRVVFERTVTAPALGQPGDVVERALLPSR